MKKIIILLWLCLLGVPAVRAANAANADWTPAKSWVFVVGLLEWKHPDFLHSFPKDGRRDTLLTEYFKDRGVSADHILLMQDRAATTKAVRDAMKTFVAKAEKDDTLFLYFCGHGFTGDDGVVYFATYDAYDKGWAVSSIFDTLDADFHGKNAVLLADCCESGVMAELAKTHKGPTDYAVLTSVANRETSTGNWTFSDSLLDVLEGRPQVDLDGDGVITFDEASRYIRSEMRFFDEQTSAASRGGKLPAEFKLAVAQPKSDKRIGEHVEVLYEGEWWRAIIESVKDGKVHVRYASAAAREEGWVADKDVRAFNADAKPAGPGLIVGAKAQVEWHHRWWPAHVLKVNADEKKYFITYDGYGKDWDEWVGADRIRVKP